MCSVGSLRAPIWVLFRSTTPKLVGVPFNQPDQVASTWQKRIDVLALRVSGLEAEFGLGPKINAWSVGQCTGLTRQRAPGFVGP